jgi:hypothetical protein
MHYESAAKLLTAHYQHRQHAKRLPGHSWTPENAFVSQRVSHDVTTYPTRSPDPLTLRLRAPLRPARRRRLRAPLLIEDQVLTLVRDVKLSIAGEIYDPTDPVNRPLFNVLAMVRRTRGCPAPPASRTPAGP